MGNVSIVIGAQWGDEGKGKWIDILAEDAAYVARFQGGNNAGHTLYVDGEKIVLHQIPSGIFHDGQICALTAGVVVNPVELVAEMATVRKFNDLTPATLLLSARAHVINPWTIYQDGLREQNTDKPIGTTKRGIGPTYSDKASRIGIRLGQFIKDDERKSWLKSRCAQNPEFQKHYDENRAEWDKFESVGEFLAPFVCDADLKVRKAIYAGKKLLLEGAQGALLDIDHGTYPYVTSSSTAAGGACASLGFSPKRIDKIYGVAKAYLTRVGEGPFSTELFDDDGKALAKKGHEFGATTGRPRRCGWLDAVALKYAVEVNGLDGVILNKFDILGGFKEVKMATAYKHPTLGIIEDFPWDAEVLNACEPVYETYAGWTDDIPTKGKIADMPATALAYIAAVEKAVGAPVTMVGTGVNRADGLYR